MILCGDALTVLRTLPPGSVQCCVTSPPYWGLRDYGVEGQLGLERTPNEYVAKLVEVFGEVRRVLAGDGTLWVNLGDSYARMQEGNVPQTKNHECIPPVMTGRVKNAGLKPKDLVGIPWRVAFALQADGWYLRSDVIWAKPNPMPESVTDRPTKAHEYLFLLAKAERYYYDEWSVKEPASSDIRERSRKVGEGQDSEVGTKGCAGNCGMRNRRSVWTIATQPYKEAHFATFPEALVEPCILAGCPEGGTVLDPFAGSGTVGVVARKTGRKFVGIELNPQYVEMAKRRIHQVAPLFSEMEEEDE
jgi:DNA modification methylase